MSNSRTSAWPLCGMAIFAGQLAAMYFKAHDYGSAVVIIGAFFFILWLCNRTR